jgi:tetratricopeptide (TPR) repeat protein
MINHHDREEIEIKALRLIDRAEDLVNKGKGKEAIDLYEKAAQKYLDLGSYMKLDELFIKISTIISRFKNNIQAMYRLKSIIRKTEELDLYEISAKLLMQLGNLSYRMKDYETAGQSWKKASDHFYNIDPDEYYNLSSELLLRAGQALERTSTSKDEGERLILKALMKVNKFDELYHTEEKRALKLLNMEQYEPAAKKYQDISKYFEKAIENVDDLIQETDYVGIMKNAKSRLLHLAAEYKALAALSLRASKNREFNPRIKTIAHHAINLALDSITILKEVLISKGSEKDKEDILRITFDTLLISILQEMLGEKKIEPIEFLLDNFNKKNSTLVKRIKNSPFYKLTERIEKLGIEETLDRVKETKLGHLDKVKETLISYF